MLKKYSFTPGPSELYFTVPDHVQQALKDGVCVLSHRSKKFEAINKEAVENVRALLGVPAEYHVVFTGSATEIWERILQNGVASHSYHLVNGSFSKRFYEFSGLLGRKATKLEVPLGEGFEMAHVQVPSDAEMICTTINETSTGVAMPVEDLYSLRSAYPDKLLVVDAVSAVPYPNIDFTKIDSLFFSVQKGMGLPAGLGVWIFNDRMVKKSEQMLQQGISVGTYHTIPQLVEYAQKNQTPETPNVLAIYLLGKVAGDMLKRGVLKIRQETDYKAALLYQTIEEKEGFSIFVKNPRHRSKTVLVANTTGPAAEVIARMAPHGLDLGSGYGKYKDSQIRIANFPTHSKELFEMLSDKLA